ncbi:MAG: hypothetical protein ACKO0Z_03575, partial [Betaproteobacteria bacterium]
MPDRLIRDEILESERWVALKDNADRLAYIALLLRVDDYGNFSAERFRLMRLWRDFGITTTELVSKTLAELIDHELIGLYEVEKKPFLHVMRFKNMRRYWSRKYPHSPFDEQVKNETKQEHTKKFSADLREACANPSGGVGRGGVGEVLKPSPRASRTVRKSDVDLEHRRKTWLAYSDAYLLRYKVEPADNAEARSAIKRFCSKIPLADCPLVAAYYVSHNGSYYVSKGHDPKHLASDAAKLRTEW